MYRADCVSFVITSYKQFSWVGPVVCNVMAMERFGDGCKLPSLLQGISRKIGEE